MTRPFRSSDGIFTALTVESATCSAANRWMAIKVISRLSLLADCSALSMISRRTAAASAALFLDSLEVSLRLVDTHG